MPIKRFIQKVPVLRYRYILEMWKLAKLQRWAAGIGRMSSLSQTLLKLTAPGVPDIYQGNAICLRLEHEITYSPKNIWSNEITCTSRDVIKEIEFYHS